MDRQVSFGLYETWRKSSDSAHGMWWVLGKGPTFAQHGEVVKTSDSTLGLNDVCTKRPVDIAHAVDADAIPRMVSGRFNWLVVPYYMHLRNFPKKDRPLDYFLRETPGEYPQISEALKSVASQGRLLTYRSSLTKRLPHPDGIGNPITTVNFSSEPAVELLLRAGADQIQLLGIDGGTEYASDFTHLTPLTNGVASFDIQFEVIARLSKQYGVPVTHPFRKI
jgi:hypothetical protein